MQNALEAFPPMPELPEVQTVVTGLSRAITGRRLVRVEQRRPDLRFPFPDGFVQRLTGATVTGVTRRAKYIVIATDRPDALLVHLGMTGRMSVVEGPAGTGEVLGSYVYDSGADPKHDHVVFHLEGSGAVVFNDPRRFGYMDLVDGLDVEACTHFKALGPEPLSEAFSVRYLAEMLAGRSGPIKALLLDQRVVAGLGNIYVCEALFRAGIAPARAGGKVSRAAIARLVPAIKDILIEAIAYGGSTLRDFAAADGAAGAMQERFDVYDREGAVACRDGRCGTVERFVQGGRSTFWCPAVQR